MKKYFVILFMLVAGLSACKKDETFDANAQAATDDATIQAYLKANNITAVKDVSGLYYTIVTQGTGNYPTSGSTVTVNYVGKLLNGTQFDANTGFKTSLGAVIRGWTIGVPKIQTGGSINLYIPSGLGYANNATGAIPANSVLVFRIDLLSIN
ncbi:MAG: FKBP-type peptidyl-prolyl cis-trans isomerase [Bacteroidota bacterium]